MGFGYDALKQLNPRIIMANVSAYGQFGPYRDQIGYDPIGQIGRASGEGRRAEAGGGCRRWGSDWSSAVCSSDLQLLQRVVAEAHLLDRAELPAGHDRADGLRLRRAEAAEPSHHHGERFRVRTVRSVSRSDRL